MSPSALAVDQLVKQFGTRTAVGGVSFQIQRGEAVGLLGPNGAGKTTTLSMLAGLVTPDSGTVFIQGSSLKGDADPAKRSLGLATQELALYEELSATENLDFFGALYGLHGGKLQKAQQDVLAFTGLSDRSREPVRGFSGGMKRRLNLAVALLHDPEILLLDEPTVGVDPQSRNALLESIDTLRQRGKTIVYTTHYMEEVERLCSRVIIIDEGRVRADAPVAILKAQLGQGIRLELGIDDTDRARAHALLSNHAAVVSLEDIPSGLRVALPDVDRAAIILQVLGSGQVPVHSLATRQPSLEDVFLQLTGKTLRD